MFKKLFFIFQNISKENRILLGIFFLIFSYVMSKPPIVSYDTIGYLAANIKRYPGYTLLIRGFQFIFNDYYQYILVCFQVIINLFSIFIIFKNITQIFTFNFFINGLLLIILILPIFPPISLANNLASEGLSYPLYLLLISTSIDFLFKDQKHKIVFISILFIALNLTRGQFFIIPAIISFLYFLQKKKTIFQNGNLKYIIILLVLPLISNLIEKSFKKVVYGHFVTSPYSYINAVTLPLFVSNISDTTNIKDIHHKNIFVLSHNRIDSLSLLSSKIEGSYYDKYMVFHENFPKICNQNLHEQGEDYYNKLNGVSELSTILTEQASKKMFPVLIKNNFKDWFSIYITGIIYGFYSVYVVLFFLIVFIYSGILSLKKYNLENFFLFFSSLLIFSNAMIVGIACHSIMRYLIYNYFLAFIIIIILIRKLTSRI
jgi:O-antigen ligase